MTALDDAEWSPGTKYLRILDQANSLLADEQRTVRDVYYALESRGNDYDYRQVKRALVKDTWLGCRRRYLYRRQNVIGFFDTSHPPGLEMANPLNLLFPYTVHDNRQRPR